MHRLDSSAWRFLSGLASLLLAWVLLVGGGMDVDVEHDRQQRRNVWTAVVLASGGVSLLWLSLRRGSKDRR